MPLVTCPRYAASVYAIAAGENVGIMGAADLKRCERVRHNERTKSGVDLLLVCAEMRKAMEAEIGPIFDYGEEVAWSRDSHGKRFYERWEQLEGTLLIDEQRHPSVVLDISPGGAAIWTESAPALTSGTEVWFELEGMHRFPAQLVRLNGRVLGLMFLLGQDQRQSLTAWLLRRREALKALRT